LLPPAVRQGHLPSLLHSREGSGEHRPVDINALVEEAVNLAYLSNGFYAASKRKELDNGVGYEPPPKASTKSLGDRVEIRIRDNGTGILPEVREKMLNPFFTTKPAGEGTGLGLSITHDIIVKQHSGSIRIDTQPGEFTEIRIVLPRAAAFPHEAGEMNESAHSRGTR
jgi:two-component system, NtrC family, sensor kinase